MKREINQSWLKRETLITQQVFSEFYTMITPIVPTRYVETQKEGNSEDAVIEISTG